VCAVCKGSWFAGRSLCAHCAGAPFEKRRGSYTIARARILERPLGYGQCSTAAPGGRRNMASRKARTPAWDDLSIKRRYEPG